MVQHFNFIKNNMRIRLVFSIVIALLAGTSNAQRIGCVHSNFDTRSMSRSDGSMQMLPDPVNFDPQKIYRQPVVLIAFSDTDFSMEDPVNYYNRIFNETGYNNGVGKGCVADYFREQSAGRLNLQFDIYGPIKISEKAGGHRGVYTGYTTITEAMEKLCGTEQTDFAIYDWDGDGLVNQVLFVASGPSGSQVSGHLWPNTGFSFLELPGGIKAYFTSITCELWSDNTPCGIGTIIHEFCHCLGLPDIYPMSPATAYSTVDEWDIMDGGNNTNKGWCPPNLSAMEKMYLGWSAPIELTESTSIRNMRPLCDGGETYIIRSSGNSDEFYLLENRCQEGWDYGCPGNGLLIFHVEYNKLNWCNNNVNTSDTHYTYDLFHADGKNYRDWDPNNNGNDISKWTMDNSLRSIYLSTSPYPYTNPTTQAVLDSLTDNSEPAANLYTANADGKNYLGKAITNIKLSEDGSISFDFMKTGLSDVSDIISDAKATVTGWYDLNGRKLSNQPHRPGIYVTFYSDGTKKKCFRK